MYMCVHICMKNPAYQPASCQQPRWRQGYCIKMPSTCSVYIAIVGMCMCVCQGLNKSVSMRTTSVVLWLKDALTDFDKLILINFACKIISLVLCMPFISREGQIFSTYFFLLFRKKLLRRWKYNVLKTGVLKVEILI